MTTLRESMPFTAQIIDSWRASVGRDKAHELIRKAMDGEPGYFYAKENGLTFGTPDTRVVSVVKWDERGIAYRTDAPWMIEAIAWCEATGIELPPRVDYGCFDEATRLAQKLRKILAEAKQGEMR
jgi:hypothetical protein